MSVAERRSRSTTAISQRPPSRDSTASIQSGAPRLARADSIPQYSQSSYGTQFAPGPHQQQQHRHHHQQQLDQLAALQHMQSAAQANTIPHQQQQYHSHPIPMATDNYASYQQQQPQQLQNEASAYHHHQMQQYNPHMAGFDQFAAMVSQHAQPPHAQPQPAHAMAAQHSVEPEDARRRGGPANTQTNEKELQRALEENANRSLKDVAKEVLESERTSRAEKTKQLFAMLWLSKSCEPAKTSVPRSRVYSSYAKRCADERVQTLNPASFGKLVRIIFKGIQTRRLGVRGESKYHYVDLALKEETADSENGFSRHLLGHEQEAHGPATRVLIDFNTLPRFQADTATIPPEDSPLASPVLAPRRDFEEADGAVFAEPMTRGYGVSVPYSQRYPQRLAFPTAEDEIIHNDVELPSLWPFAPSKVDDDAADALSALYRSHCTLLIDYFKKCKEKQFWKTFSSFQGTLTVPVQKLLCSPSMATWVRECDIYMYQKMLAFLTRAALQVLPPNAMLFFEKISQHLHGFIAKTFQGLPSHVVEARLEPATLFCELISRMIKVNNSAHAASGVLELDQHREQLHDEWRNYINPKRLMESELPGCGYDETYKILTEDIANILKPLILVTLDEDGLPYANQTDSNDNYIDRIDSLLRSLPRRFPQAPARTIVDCVKNLGTAAMREFTMQGAHSFHAWWIVKVFIDEYIQWLVTSGGFLAHKPMRRGQTSPMPSQLDGSVLNSAEGSRRQSMAPADTGMNHSASSHLSSRKRRSGDFENDTSHQAIQASSKRQRMSPEPEAQQPHFEQPHPSFATTQASFGSNATTDGLRTDTPQDALKTHEFDIDDSGIGMDDVDIQRLRASTANMQRATLGSTTAPANPSAKSRHQKSKFDSAPLVEYQGFTLA